MNIELVIDFLLEAWLIWAVYAVVSIGGYCLWYYLRKKMRSKQEGTRVFGNIS